MPYPKNFILSIAACGSLIFTASKVPNQFPLVVSVSLPLLAQSLSTKDDDK
jgi:hypothetical protein